MTKSYKMLLLLAMLASDCLPGEQGVVELSEAFARRARRSALLVADMGAALDDPTELRRSLERNPIHAWVGGNRSDGTAYFAYEDETFRTTFSVPNESRDTFQSLAREILEWRLAEYLDRSGLGQAEGQSRLRVRRSSHSPILFLDRERNPGLPSGWTRVEMDGEVLELNFVKIAVNVARRDGSEKNVLPEILGRWFGEDAGAPGTNHIVVAEGGENGWRIVPEGRKGGDDGPELWRSYSRAQIPPCFGQTFNPGSWNQGFVPVPGHLILLVTLNKQALHADHSYDDRFVDATTFQWQSQSRTAQDDKHGRMIQDPPGANVTPHLFVRSEKRLDGKAAPFVYCGPLSFVSWQGERPITVVWKLGVAVPDALRGQWGPQKS